MKALKSIESSHPFIAILKKKVEEKFFNEYKLNLESTAGLQTFCEDVLKSQICTDTIRRIWGGKKGYDTIRVFTLSILCQYIGEKDWDGFLKNNQDRSIESELNQPKNALLSSELKIFQKVTLSWLPDRVCTVQYLGENQYKVVAVENSQTLSVDDTFYCASFVPGESLTIDTVCHNGKLYASATIGKNNGISFVKIED